MGFQFKNTGDFVIRILGLDVNITVQSSIWSAVALRLSRSKRLFICLNLFPVYFSYIVKQAILLL